MPAFAGMTTIFRLHENYISLARQKYFAHITREYYTNLMAVVRSAQPPFALLYFWSGFLFFNLFNKSEIDSLYFVAMG